MELANNLASYVTAIITAVKCSIVQTHFSFVLSCMCKLKQERLNAAPSLTDSMHHLLKQKMFFSLVKRCMLLIFETALFVQML
jgi:hypothetical protein